VIQIIAPVKKFPSKWPTVITYIMQQVHPRAYAQSVSRHIDPHMESWPSCFIFCCCFNLKLALLGALIFRFKKLTFPFLKIFNSVSIWWKNGNSFSHRDCTYKILEIPFVHRDVCYKYIRGSAEELHGNVLSLWYFVNFMYFIVFPCWKVVFRDFPFEIAFSVSNGHFRVFRPFSVIAENQCP
jgi:hypothetical protein